MVAEVVNHLWQSTAFAVVAGLLTLAFRKNRAQVRYWLWLSVSVKFLIPFSVLMSLGHDLLGRLAAGKMEIATPALSGAIVRITQPFPDTLTLAPAAPHATHWIPMAILGVWACGFAAVALARFRAWLRVRAALRASTPIDIPAPVAVRSCPGLLEPGVVGFLRPTVLLPEGILETLSRTQIEAVLAHELSHARRRDNLTAAIHMIVEAVFWFYPLVWWIGTRLVEERERACDESVLMLGNEPREYADAILNVCKHYVKSPVVCVSGIIGADLKRRIGHIMSRHIGQGLTPGRRLLLGGAAAVAIAIPLALGMMGASKGGTQSPEASNGRLPSFETASIKLDKSRMPLVGHHLLGGCYSATLNVMGLIMDAYGQYLRPLNPDQVLESPAWITTDMYDVNARVSSSIVNGEWKKLSFAQRWNEAMLMLRSLLINRFKLRVKHQKKVLRVFELVLAKNGPKIAEDRTADQPCQIFEHPRGKDLELELNVKSCAFNKVVGFLRFPELTGRASADKTGLHGGPLDVQLRRLLLDKTGLHGRYSFNLHWTPHIYSPPGTPKPSGPSLFTALREQLGLKVVSGKAPVDVIVIEHIEGPTPN